MKTPKPQISIGLQLTPWLEGFVLEDQFRAVEPNTIPTYFK
jgi:hypothetical protein